MKKFALAAMLSALAIGPAAAQDTINWLHLETNPGMVALMNEAITEYKGAHPEANFELQFLENEAYKAKLTTLLQSDDAPDIVYSLGRRRARRAGQGRRAARHRRRDLQAETKTNIGPAGVGAFTRDGKLYGIARTFPRSCFWYNKELFAQGRRRPGDDEHLGRLPGRRQEAAGRRHHADRARRRRQVAGTLLLVLAGREAGGRGWLQCRRGRRR